MANFTLNNFTRDQFNLTIIVFGKTRETLPRMVIFLVIQQEKSYKFCFISVSLPWLTLHPVFTHKQDQIATKSVYSKNIFSNPHILTQVSMSELGVFQSFTLSVMSKDM